MKEMPTLLYQQKVLLQYEEIILWCNKVSGELKVNPAAMSNLLFDRTVYGLELSTSASQL